MGNLKTSQTANMSTFGQYFKVTTYGESHCRSVGCIVDGVPPGMQLTEDDIQPQMTRRRPGQSALTTPRNEMDTVEIQSGTEFGVTLGTPIAMISQQRPETQGLRKLHNGPLPSSKSRRLDIPREIRRQGKQWRRTEFCTRDNWTSGCERD